MNSRILGGIFVLSAATFVFGQDQLPKHPKYADFQKAHTEINALGAKQMVARPEGWSEKGHLVLRDGRTFDPKKNDFVPKESVIGAADPGARMRRGGPSRGRQFTSAFSPDGKYAALYKDSNVYLAPMKTGETPTPDESKRVAITKDGSATNRIKYGSASWVYGEELDQNTAMWWSEDSKKLVFYRFDESKVLDYHVTLKQNSVQNQLYSEAYPKAGAPNPTVQLWSYDVESKKLTQVDTTFKSTDPDIAQYVYGVRFAPDGKTLLFYRTNRKQNVLELCASDLSNGSSRVVIQESNPKGWVENSPRMEWYSGLGTFIWWSEKNGYWNMYWGSLEKGIIAPITQHNFEVDRIVKVDRVTQSIYYMAHSGENPYHLQLHRVGWDGRVDKRLTDPGYHHEITISPDGTYFSDVYSSLVDFPRLQVCDAINGRMVRNLTDIPERALGDYSGAKRLVATAADGKTPIYGYYRTPKNFDPNKKYPVILRVYSGPDSGSGVERFIGPDATCELGFITAWVDGRGTKGRGRDFRMAPYRKLGIVEIDDQAEAMKELAKLPFVDGTKIGIEGTSYGGYASCMALLRHPEVFSAACASSSVTAWYHYDSIYTERFMDTPQNNPEGYKAGSAMEYVKNLTGKLCLFYGTADDNVHPSNTHQLIAALDGAGKPYRLYVGVDQGHAGLRQDRMLEFFMSAFGM
jgi:dipeptidyl-peptidase 4